MSVVIDVSAEAKREALRELLASETLGRSEQLRSFLRYVCELEIAGRGHEINEYLVGVSALGRPEGYSPAEDSSVRSRAYELRQKLERYYDLENPDAEVRVRFSKGSYAPHFVRWQKAAAVVNVVALPVPRVETVTAVPVVEVGQVRPPTAILWTAMITAAICLVSFGVWWRFANDRVDPVIQEAWGPLAQRDGNVLVCMGTNFYLIVRPYMSILPKGVPKYDAPPELYETFRQHRPLREGVKLEMHPNETVGMGEMTGVVGAANMLRQFHTAFQILPERAAPLAALRERNVVLFGSPVNSFAANEILTNAAWTMDFDAGVNELVLKANRPKSVPTFTPVRDERGEPTVIYGLITVMPSQGSTSKMPLKTVVITGISSVGSQGAMEFFSSAEAMRDLRGRFRSEGLAGFPAAYQVVVKCKTTDLSLLSYEYAGHRVLAR